MDDYKKVQIAAILVGMVLGVFAVRRWRNLRYSAGAFVLVPQVIVDAALRRWEIAVMGAVLTSILFLIDWLRWVRRQTASRDRG